MIFILNRAAVFMCVCVCKVEQKPPCRFFLLFHSVFYYSGSFNSQNKNILSRASYLYHVQFFYFMDDLHHIWEKWYLQRFADQNQPTEYIYISRVKKWRGKRKRNVYKWWNIIYPFGCTFFVLELRVEWGWAGRNEVSPRKINRQSDLCAGMADSQEWKAVLPKKNFSFPVSCWADVYIFIFLKKILFSLNFW